MLAGLRAESRRSLCGENVSVIVWKGKTYCFVENFEGALSSHFWYPITRPIKYFLLHQFWCVCKVWQLLSTFRPSNSRFCFTKKNNNKNPTDYNRAFAGQPARALIKAASSDERALAPQACSFVCRFLQAGTLIKYVKFEADWTKNTEVKTTSCFIYDQKKTRNEKNHE